MEIIRTAFLAFILSCTLLLPTGAFAGLSEGVAAYNKKDYATALREFKSLASQGNAEAQVNLGVMFGEGLGVPQDYKEAVKWYRLAADQGDAIAQYNLGLLYGDGQGVAQD